ncbi:CobW/HypB/UreG, nucleotide-binding domain-containing protein [Pelagophyceae sp. CCMP2097]|nr:CobW/HypB/UreG, nucleotide-binding domain-containing protein [Pelagophyceae sp. CCMP2097]
MARWPRLLVPGVAGALASAGWPRLLVPGAAHALMTGSRLGRAAPRRLALTRQFSAVVSGAEDMVEASAAPERTPPVTLLAGFLGAGKTSMLQGILENRKGLRVAVIVNDVASVNIDSSAVRRELRRQGDEAGNAPIELLELQNGCVCCGPQAGELAAAVLDLCKLGEERGAPFDHVVIEMSGVADPTTVRINLLDGEVYVARVVTLVDVPAFAEQWMSWDVMEERVVPADFDAYNEAPPKSAPLAMAEDISIDPCAAQRRVVTLLLAQIEGADVIALNKIDMATPRELAEATATCKALQPGATFLQTVRGNAALDALLPKPESLEEFEEVEEVACADEKCTDESHEHAHAEAAQEVCKEPKCEDTSHSHAHSHDGGVTECTEDHSHSGEHVEEGCADLDCDDRTHSHAHAAVEAPRRDTTVDALGIDSFAYVNTDRPFDYDRLLGLVQRWPIPRKEGLDLRDLKPGGAGIPGVISPWEAVLRSKGFVWLNSYPANAIAWTFAGRHFAIDDAGPWFAVLDGPDERPKTEMVIIGMDLDREALIEDLDSCLVDDEEFQAYLEYAAESAKPRFDIGALVECNLGGDPQWMPGVVVAHNYREESWDVQQTAPYQVQLDDGDIIFAPFDDDLVIRSRGFAQYDPDALQTPGFERMESSRD